MIIACRALEVKYAMVGLLLISLEIGKLGVVAGKS